MDKVEGDKRVYYLVPQEEYEKTKRLYYAFFKLNNLSYNHLTYKINFNLITKKSMNEFL